MKDKSIMEMTSTKEQNCKVCASKSHFLFEAEILNKHIVDYFKCSVCGFIQTEDPHWLSEAYNDAISSIDVGLVQRNLSLTEKTATVIIDCFDYNKKFLDYGGGYGLLVRMMRDRGFDFYRQDKYCDNLFSIFFDIEDLTEKTKFEVVTAFELFEHLENPLEELDKLFSYSDTILFSTELQPSKEIKSIQDWWYFVPEGGQHIALYTKKSLEIMAEKYNAYLYTNGSNLHLLTKNKLKNNPFEIKTAPVIKKNIVSRVLNKMINFIDKPIPPQDKITLLSRIQKDFDFAKSKLNKKT